MRTTGGGRGSGRGRPAGRAVGAVGRMVAVGAAVVPGGTVVMVVDGVRRGGQVEVGLGPLPEDEEDERALYHQVLGHLRADTAGRVRGEVPLPDDLGTLPLVLGIRMRGR